MPLKYLKVGMITTENEVYHGSIEDRPGPVVSQKFAGWGSSVIRQIVVTDSEQMIVQAIHS